MNPQPLAQGLIESSQAPVVPALEAFANTNPGFFAIVVAVAAGLLILWVVASIPVVKRAIMAFGGLLVVLWRVVQKRLSDLWARLRTPLNDRGTLEDERRGWEVERLRLEGELSKSQGIAERRRQEINKNATEFKLYRDQCEANHPIQKPSNVSQKINDEWRTKIDLRIESEDRNGLVGMGPWVLKNWGPGVAYKIYATTTDPDSKLEEEHREQLKPKESMSLFRSYTGKYSALYLGDGPRIRVIYEDAGGKEHEDFLEIPTGIFSLSGGAKKRIKR